MLVNVAAALRRFGKVQTRGGTVLRARAPRCLHHTAARGRTTLSQWFL